MAQLPAHLQKLANRGLMANARSGIKAGRPPHISIRDNTFRLVSASGDEEQITTVDKKIGVYLEAVIVAIAPGMSRLYWAKSYESGDDANPDCMSTDGVYPSPDAQDRQAERCDLCDQNRWGSRISPSGKQAKACQESKAILLFVPEYKAYYQFRITPGSFKNWTRYIKYLGEKQFEPQWVVTRMWFESQGVLDFGAAAFITEETSAEIDRDQQELDDMLADGTMPAALPAPEKEPPRAVAAPKAPPAPQPRPASQKPGIVEAPKGTRGKPAAAKPPVETLGRESAAPRSFGIVEEMDAPQGSLADEIASAFDLDTD